MGTVLRACVAFALALAVVSAMSESAWADSVGYVELVDDAEWGVDSVLRDTLNGLEFLRLDFTMGYGWNGVDAELGAGGDFEGWRIATKDEMEGLRDAAGLPAVTTDTGEIQDLATLRDWFCPEGTCLNTSSTHVYSRGLLADDYTGLAGAKLAWHFAVTLSGSTGSALVGGYDGVAATSQEVHLVRDASPVPEPASLALLGFGAAGIALRRWRRSRSGATA